jgi:hypothetical protein
MTLPFNAEGPGVVSGAFQNVDRRGRLNTQVSRVERQLIDNTVVCATTFLEQRMPRAAVAVHRLRRAGFVIVSEPCDDNTHRHESRQIQYRLVATP